MQSESGSPLLRVWLWKQVKRKDFERSPEAALQYSIALSRKFWR